MNFSVTLNNILYFCEEMWIQKNDFLKMEHRNLELRIKVQPRFKSTNKAWLNLLASLTLYYQFTTQLNRKLGLYSVKFKLNIDWKRNKNRIWMDMQGEHTRDPHTAWSAHRSVRVGAIFFGFYWSWCAPPGPRTNRLWCVDPWGRERWIPHIQR